MEPNIEIDEVNLEDLIIRGDDSKIPILIEFPRPGKEPVKAKVLVKQLTLKELGDIKVNQGNLLESSLGILKKALFKHDGSNFSEEEILLLPIGVINELSSKIMELSGVDMDEQDLRNF